VASRRLPKILIIDDHLEEAESRRLSFAHRANATACTPDEVSIRQLMSADLVLVDFVLNDWLPETGGRIACRPVDGICSPQRANRGAY
jgi:hypothetical protein